MYFDLRSLSREELAELCTHLSALFPSGYVVIEYEVAQRYPFLIATRGSGLGVCLSDIPGDGQRITWMDVIGESDAIPF